MSAALIACIAVAVGVAMNTGDTDITAFPDDFYIRICQRRDVLQQQQEKLLVQNNRRRVGVLERDDRVQQYR